MKTSGYYGSILVQKMFKEARIYPQKVMKSKNSIFYVDMKKCNLRIYAVIMFVSSNKICINKVITYVWWSYCMKKKEKNGISMFRKTSTSFGNSLTSSSYQRNQLLNVFLTDIMLQNPINAFL